MDIGLQELTEMSPGDFPGAETHEVLGGHLAVDQSKASFPKVRDQMDEGDFRGVAQPGKHRFTEEDPVEGDSVKAAGKAASLPAFDRVCVAEFVQPQVCLLHFL